MASADGIRALAEPALASAGLELWDVEIGHGVVRILVDTPGGVDLDALTTASGILSPLLDDHPEVSPERRYELEVSSPGVERTLRTADQFRRYVGEQITVKTRVPVAGARRHRGELVGVGDGGVVLRPADAPGEARVEIAYDDIERARTVLVWGPTPAPAARRRAARPGAKASAALDAKDAGS